MPTKKVETIVEDTQQRLIATQLIAGIPKIKIATALNMNTRSLDKIIQSEDFRAFMQEYSNSLVSSAANTWKAAMIDRIGNALGVLDHHLKQKNLEAVKVVMKSVGLDKVQPEAQTNTAITVVLPGQEQKTIEVIDVTEVKEGLDSPAEPELQGE